MATIGNLGRIDVRFVPGAVKEPPPAVPGCHGGKVVTEEGHFVGVIRFRGERGYAQVRADHASGTVTRTPALTCGPVAQPPKHDKAVEKEEAEAATEEAGDEVELSASAGQGRIHFDASRLTAESKGAKKLTAVTFVAVGSRQRGKIKEISFAVATLLKGSRFLSPDPLHPTRGAVIRPPSPFSGSATFSRASGSASWTGDLKVDLPGFGPVPLAGGGSHASMCEAPSCHLSGAS